MGIIVLLVLIAGGYFWIKSQLNKSATIKYNQKRNLAEDMLARARRNRLELLADLNELSAKFNGANREEYIKLTQTKESLNNIIDRLTNTIIPGLEGVVRWRTDTPEGRIEMDLAIMNLERSYGGTLEELNTHI